MNKQKIKKDLMAFYMFRNAFATLLAAFCAFMISLISYYQCHITEAIRWLFVNDIYTFLYFILLWVFDYLVFEVSKIMYDIYEEKVTFVPSLFLIALSIIIYFVPILDLFQYNLCFLCLLITLRMIKEMWRRTPQLFTWIHRKRPESGLK